MGGERRKLIGEGRRREGRGETIGWREGKGESNGRGKVDGEGGRSQWMLGGEGRKLIKARGKRLVVGGEMRDDGGEASERGKGGR